MNYAVSVIFRAIPLAMMGVCIGFGVYVWTAAATPENFTAGHVVTFLGHDLSLPLLHCGDN